MKTIAFYLPQFHRVEENDKWWGMGYTEWTAVKNGKALFQEHYQPRKPLMNNYYDLMKKETMQWQADLMKRYDIYGMCFYHYYFQKGKKILERPAENLLHWKDIDMPFCFSWANESWARTWSKLVNKNEWDRIAESKVIKENEEGILLKQAYGNERDWKEHFNYLIPFFKDDRYIKVDNRPVFIIYKPDDIFCLSDMMGKWNEWGIEQGFDGIYFIGTNSKKEGFHSYLRQELNYSWLNMEGMQIDYDELCTQIIENAIMSDRNCYLCGCPGHDNTPRMGKAGRVVVNSEPEKFYKLMRTLFYLSEQRNHELIFVNAWNEWAEGMYLEPDTRYKYGFLEALQRAGTDYKRKKEEERSKIGNILSKLPIKQNNRTYFQAAERYKSIMKLLNQWLNIKEEGKSLTDYFIYKGYKYIAVYGIGMLGKHLITETRNSNIHIMYGIDKKKEQLNYPFPIYDLNDELLNVDVIVVTVVYEFDVICSSLRKKFNGAIISLAEVMDFIDCET